MTRRRWIYPTDGSPPFEVTPDHITAPRGPFVFGDLPAYESPIDGREIHGRVARREDLARSGSRPWEGLAQERQEADRQRGYEAQRVDRRLEQTVHRSMQQISESSRRALQDL